ncbi:hypothetical protein LOOC260_102280 [Paucilactobacillus hokkaidonensis JCM 18461]|uniref:Uncharacterized protein n=4 Tax=Paucilactobacillus hokkaidonensis TaxID=1193095 RepID=A0A0A1GWN4_9LACO|nr:competence protein ComK [Paucilactobacillus hokkaidonensis]KRO08786.1 hypothetical protein IV59_GL001125 [Paucilactobacillus hokkaidonensis]BAP84806.1 hypothetical protein LOOC260_102280 [Paucilactobacillus hokkaidonensis JCM 18461]
MSTEGSNFPLLNLETLTDQDAEVQTENGAISWKKTLLFRQIEVHQVPCTFILYTDKAILVKRPLKELLVEFTTKASVLQFEMYAYAKFLKLRGSYHCVSGAYQMIASRGTNSAEATWLMSHHIESSHFVKNEHLMHITFKNHQTVALDISKASLEKRIDEAHQIGVEQITHDRQYNILHGTYNDVKDQWGECNLDECGYHMKEHNITSFSLFKEKLLIKRVWKEVYSESVSGDIDQMMDRILKQSFHG